jgi:hypothetical protein
MTQTAVEWLYQHLFPKQLDGFSEEEWSKIDSAFEQAKEMEKEQIRDSFLIGWSEPSKYESDSLIYYNQNYGGSK